MPCVATAFVDAKTVPLPYASTVFACRHLADRQRGCSRMIELSPTAAPGRWRSASAGSRAVGSGTSRWWRRPTTSRASWSGEIHGPLFPWLIAFGRFRGGGGGFGGEEAGEEDEEDEEEGNEEDEEEGREGGGSRAGLETV